MYNLVNTVIIIDKHFSFVDTYPRNTAYNGLRAFSSKRYFRPLLNSVNTVHEMGLYFYLQIIDVKGILLDLDVVK